MTFANNRPTVTDVGAVELVLVEVAADDGRPRIVQVYVALSQHLLITLLEGLTQGFARVLFKCFQTRHAPRKVILDVT